MNCFRFCSGMFFVGISLLCSCSGEDRSDEMPRVPVVRTTSAVVDGRNVCTMGGMVDESHNSALRECGFVYGVVGENSMQRKADTARTFTARADSLEDGDYFCVAYAKNGMGVSYGDTMRFVVNEK